MSGAVRLSYVRISHTIKLLRTHHLFLSFISLEWDKSDLIFLVFVENLILGAPPHESREATLALRFRPRRHHGRTFISEGSNACLLGRCYQETACLCQQGALWGLVDLILISIFMLFRIRWHINVVMFEILYG